MLNRLEGLVCTVLVLASTVQAASNPVPFISQPLSPARANPGTKNLTIALRGTGFVSGSTVKWNGFALPTTFLSRESITAKVPASDLAVSGAALVTVQNPSPGGGTSNIAMFEITRATPTAIIFENRIGTPATNYSLATADFNGDGHLDLAAAMSTDIAVLLGNGDSTFKVSSFPTTAQFVGGLVAGDFDGDGKLDLAFPDPYHNLVHVLLGHGDGTFTEKSVTIVGSHPMWAATGDFNGDGKIDLAVVNRNTGNVSILLGTGDGTFSRKPPVKVGLKPNGVTVGDFNGDGKLDLAVVNSGSNTVSVLLGRGDGTFSLKSSNATGASPYGVVASDFNGDGKIDLAVTNSCGNAISCQTYGSVTVLLGVGDGTFTESSVVLSGYHTPLGIVAGDFNADGKTDLAVVAQNESAAVVVFGDGKGHFGSLTSSTTGAYPEFAALGDFNEDGRLDFAVSNTFAFDGVLAVSIEQQSPVAFYPAVLTFPPQTVGTTSAPKTVKFTNIGLSPVNISRTGVDGFYAETNDCPASLVARASCTFTVTFTPGLVGLTGGMIVVVDDVLGITQTSVLEGIGK